MGPCYFRISVREDRNQAEGTLPWTMVCQLLTSYTPAPYYKALRT